MTAVKKLQIQLKTLIESGTPAERVLARYFNDNISTLPFETAASIAEKLDLSQMTVGRFLRSLGFQGLDPLKLAFRSDGISSAWRISADMDILRKDLAEGRLLAEVMADQMETLRKLYELSRSSQWSSVVRRIVKAREVFVASYQNISGIAKYFSEQLSYARDRVRYMDGLNGTYSELLAHPPKGSLLIVVDTRRFATKSRILANAASEAGYEVVLVTDQSCPWANEVEACLVLPISRHRTWDHFMSLAALLDFLVLNVVIESGEAANKRTKDIETLQTLFGDFEKY